MFNIYLCSRLSLYFCGLFEPRYRAPRFIAKVTRRRLFIFRKDKHSVPRHRRVVAICGITNCARAAAIAASRDRAFSRLASRCDRASARLRGMHAEPFGYLQNCARSRDQLTRLDLRFSIAMLNCKLSFFHYDKRNYKNAEGGLSRLFSILSGKLHQRYCIYYYCPWSVSMQISESMQ